MTADELARMSLAELEHVYKSAPLAPLPSGVWEGHYLREFPMSLPKRLLARAMFRWPLFGLDLNRQAWWFRSVTSVVGTFETSVGRSKWRETDVVRLDYQRTGPPIMKGMLYDELRPLGPDLILGLGGSNHDAPRGTWFFFSLTPVPIL